MSKIYFSIILMFFCFFPKIAISDNGVDHKLWVYEKVSGVDVFGKHDLNTINNLNEIYSKVKFTFSGKTLTIKNDSLKITMCVRLIMLKLKKHPYHIICLKKQWHYMNGFLSMKVCLYLNIFIF